jgi:outer membrane protein OmpA-like peptidoglycan-associated protein
VSAAPVRAHDALPPRRIDRTAEREADAVARGGSRRPRLGERPTTTAHGGRALQPELRTWAEPRVGVDLSTVRVHDDAEAHAAAAERNARAVTAGDDVLLAEGEHRPGTPEGRELLLHELVHVAQQRERGERVAQLQPEPRRTEGIGRTPPEDSFAVASLPLVEGEDTHVLFAHDKVELDAAVIAERARRVFRDHSGAVVVSVHGYASNEGDKDYNVNLSAHRAVAVRNAIAAVLPAGSVVNLIAHGATDAFGAPARNRRVGLDVWDMPAQSDVSLDADRYLRRHHPFGFGPGLTLEPFELPPEPRPRTPAEVAEDATKPRHHGGGVLDPTGITDPGGTVIGRSPGVAPFLQPDPFDFVASRIPWGPLAEALRQRSVPLGAGDQTVILNHWRFYHPLARVLFRLPGAGVIFDSPDDLMMSLTRKMINSSLAGDHPNAVELFDREALRFGVPEPFYTPTPDVLTFDPTFRNVKVPWWPF